MNAQSERDNENEDNTAYSDESPNEKVLQEMQKVLMPLPVPVPPLLEEALGYKGRSRWVAFYSTKNGGEVLSEDGYWTSGCDASAWTVFINHPAVRPFLQGLHFGGSGHVAAVYLLLDRHERRAFAGALMVVVRLLAAQHSGPPSREERDARLSQSVELMGREADTPPLPSEMRRWKAEQLRLETQMRLWLDTQLAQAHEADGEGHTEGQAEVES